MNVSPFNSADLYEASLLLQIEEVFIEKDWFVTKLIKDTYSFTSSDPLELIFSGGTALSKAHKKIARFSEDVDFRIHSPDPFKRTMLSRWRKSLVEYLHEKGWSVLEEDIVARDEGRYIAIKIDYPTLYPQHRSLRPRLKLEFRARSIQLPPTMCEVSSFLNSAAKKESEVPEIRCLNLIENAADKLAALAWRVPARLAQVKRSEDPNLVRHIYDLASLLPSITDGGIFVSCLEASMRADAEETHKDEQSINPCAQIRTALKILQTTSTYRDEYEIFVGGMVYDNMDSCPSFDEGLTAIETLLKLWARSSE
jgi:predicted nucleotidyltransferase component of viral defense system